MKLSLAYRKRHIQQESPQTNIKTEILKFQNTEILLQNGSQDYL